jgi:hypothetical protein
VFHARISGFLYMFDSPDFAAFLRAGGRRRVVEFAELNYI